MFKTIVYHLIGIPDSYLNLQQKRMFVSPERFTEHIIALLNGGYRFITLEEAEKQLTGESKSSDKDILITFDDGYINTLKTIRSHGMRKL